MSLQTLPYDLLFHIAQYLDIDDVHNLQAVCSHARSLVPKIKLHIIDMQVSEDVHFDPACVPFPRLYSTLAIPTTALACIPPTR